MTIMSERGQLCITGWSIAGVGRYLWLCMGPVGLGRIMPHRASGVLKHSTFLQCGSIIVELGAGMSFKSFTTSALDALPLPLVLHPQPNPQHAAIPRHRQPTLSLPQPPSQPLTLPVSPYPTKSTPLLFQSTPHGAQKPHRTS